MSRHFIPLFALFLTPGLAQLQDRTITAQTHGQTLCAQSDDMEIGNVWHFTEGFEQVLYMCQVWHDGLKGGERISLTQTIAKIQNGEADSIIFDSDFAVTQSCSLVALLHLSSTTVDAEEQNEVFNVTSTFKTAIGNCPVSEVDITGTFELDHDEDGNVVGFFSQMDVIFSGAPTGAGVGDPIIEFGDIPFPATGNSLNSRDMTLVTSGETVCFQSDDDEEGIVWHITDGFEQNLYMCQVFHQKPDGHIISLQQAIALMQAGNADQIIFDSDFKVTQDCSFVVMIAAASNDASNTRFEITSAFKDVEGNCPFDNFSFRGLMTITDAGSLPEEALEEAHEGEEALEAEEALEVEEAVAGEEAPELEEMEESSLSLLSLTGTATFSGNPVALSPLLPRVVEATTHGLTLCSQADDADPGIVWHFTEGFNQILYLCQAFHSKSQGGAIISLTEAIAEMQTGQAADIIFDSDFTISQECSLVAMLSATLSPLDGGNLTLFDVTSMFKTTHGLCPNSGIDVTGTMTIVDAGQGLTGEFNVTFDEGVTDEEVEEVEVVEEFEFEELEFEEENNDEEEEEEIQNPDGVGNLGDKLVNRTLRAQTNGNTACTQSDDGEDGIVVHFFDGFEQLLYLCQAYHDKTIPQGTSNLIPLEDAIQALRDGNADNIIFDSDFVVTQTCSFVALLTATPTTDPTVFDVTSQQKNVVGKCPQDTFSATGTMTINNLGLVQSTGAGLSTQLDLVFSGDMIDNGNEGNNGGGNGSNSTNKTLLALTIVFAVLAVCALVLVCYLYSSRKDKRDLSQRGSEFHRMDA